MEVEVYRESLLRKRGELLGGTAAKPLQWTMENNSGRQGDMADQASGNNEVHIQLKLKQTDAKILQAIEEALRRIEQGTYGICRDCGEPIAPARLNAIPWTRVHDVPAYAYFDHSAHINVGIGCATCHGRVDRMEVVMKTESMSMGWCIDCHNDPGPNNSEQTDYDDSWPSAYATEAVRIRTALGDLLESIEHVRSTSVPGLAAKPRIDIMPGLRSENMLDLTVEPMTALGFRYIPDYEDEMPERRLFTRDESEAGMACNVHTVAIGSEFWERHLLFRNYLRAHPETAREYARLKHHLASTADRQRPRAERRDDGPQAVTLLAGHFMDNAQIFKLLNGLRYRRCRDGETFCSLRHSDECPYL
jgi:RNA polymerase-binding protein DksA